MTTHSPWLLQIRSFLIFVACLALSPAPARSREAASSLAASATPDGNEEAKENSFGLPDDLPLAEAVARFNQRTKRLSGEPNGNTQPPLTVEEVVTALCYRLALGTDLTKDGRDTYVRIVTTRMLPKGAHLDFGRGWVGARPLGRGTKPMDIKLWEITLDVWMDRYPPGPGESSPAPRLIIRMQHLRTGPSSLKGPEYDE